MRYLVFASLFLLSAVLMACSNPAKTARREVDRILSLSLTADARLQRVTGEAFDAIAKAEGEQLRAEFQREGCATVASSQPATATETCKAIAQAGLNRYETRIASVASVARTADRSIEALWSVLRVAVDVIEDMELGGKASPSVVERLTALLKDAWRLYLDGKAAYERVLTVAGGGK